MDLVTFVSLKVLESSKTYTPHTHFRTSCFNSEEIYAQHSASSSRSSVPFFFFSNCVSWGLEGSGKDVWIFSSIFDWATSLILGIFTGYESALTIAKSKNRSLYLWPRLKAEVIYKHKQKYLVDHLTGTLYLLIKQYHYALSLGLWTFPATDLFLGIQYQT